MLNEYNHITLTNVRYGRHTLPDLTGWYEAWDELTSLLWWLGELDEDHTTMTDTGAWFESLEDLAISDGITEGKHVELYVDELNDYIIADWAIDLNSLPDYFPSNYPREMEG